MATTQFQATSGVLIDGVNIQAGRVDVDGTTDSIILDSDGDTHISAPTNNQIDISIGGADDFSITANSFNVLSGSCIAGPTSTFYSCMPILEEQSLSGAGAINVTTYNTQWTTTGANAGTLADGVVKGQLKRVELVVNGGNGTLTPSHFASASGSKITFAALGDYALLIFNGTSWVPILLGNSAVGGIGPVIS